MERKGLDMTVSLIVTLVVAVAVVLILSFLLTSRTDALAAFGIENTNLDFTGFIGGGS